MSGVLLAALLCAAGVVAHICVSHLTSFERKEPVLVLFMAATVGAFVVLYWPLSQTVPLFSQLRRVPLAIDLLAGLSAAAFLTLGYLEFWSLIERSFSLRMLIDLARSPHGTAPASVLAESYGGDRGLEWMMAKRLEDLEGARMVRNVGGSPLLTRRGAAVAAVFGTLLLLLGFDDR